MEGYVQVYVRVSVDTHHGKRNKKNPNRHRLFSTHVPPHVTTCAYLQHAKLGGKKTLDQTREGVVGIREDFQQEQARK